MTQAAIPSRKPSRRKTAEPQAARVVKLEWIPLEYLLFRLSPEDRADFFGQSPTTNPLEIAHVIMHARNGLAWAVFVGGRPAGAFGVYEIHPGTWGLWLLGGDVPEVSFATLGLFLGEAQQHIRDNGGWRVELKTRLDRVGSHDRLSLLGFTQEAVLRRFGTDRANYALYAFLLDDEEKPESEPEPAMTGGSS